MPPYSQFPEVENSDELQNGQQSGGTIDLLSSGYDAMPASTNLADQVLHNPHPCAECAFARVKVRQLFNIS